MGSNKLNTLFPQIEVEALCRDLLKTDWPPEHDTTHFTNVFNRFRNLIKQGGVSVEEVEQEVVLQLLDQYLNHEDWRHRICALLFLASLLELVPPRNK